MYTEARDIEARNRDEYVKRAKSVKDPKVRALFELVCQHEIGNLTLASNSGTNQNTNTVGYLTPICGIYRL